MTYYSSIQKYIDKNAQYAPNNELRNIASDVESYTLALFDKLNEIKIKNCVGFN